MQTQRAACACAAAGASRSQLAAWMCACCTTMSCHHCHPGHTLGKVKRKGLLLHMLPSRRPKHGFGRTAKRLQSLGQAPAVWPLSQLRTLVHIFRGYTGSFSLAWVMCASGICAAAGALTLSLKLLTRKSQAHYCKGGQMHSGNRQCIVASSADVFLPTFVILYLCCICPFGLHQHNNADKCESLLHRRVCSKGK